MNGRLVRRKIKVGQASCLPWLWQAGSLPHLLLACCCLVAGGCAEDIHTVYGQRTGPEASDSVNGTAVLAKMFEQAGHRVFSWRLLSPKLARRADCIVWFPDDFDLPDDEVCTWLEQWLVAEPGRTLIYVGRDFDAACWYWKTIGPLAPAGQRKLIQQRKKWDKTEFRQRRAEASGSDGCRWFSVDRSQSTRKVQRLAGLWSRGVDPKKAAIELGTSLEYYDFDPFKVLLDSDGDALVVRDDSFGQGQLITVTNGSFLLNLPLVNHEHRKLAGRLIAKVGAPSQTVVFLESGPGGPPVSEEDPAAEMPSGLDILLMKPTRWVFLHLAVVGVLLCFSRWPIFGIAREPDRPGTSDFGKHVEAMAELMQQSRDRDYAMARVAQYQQGVGGEGARG